MAAQGRYNILFRGPFVAFLVALGLWQVLWDSLFSLLQPVFTVYDTINDEKLTLCTIIDQFIKSVLSMWVLVWQTCRAVVRMVTKPCRTYVEKIEERVEELRDEHVEKTQSGKDEKRQERNADDGN
ncbi:hypothetical protein ACOMHN_066319 [Nucella lapillus]